MLGINLGTFLDKILTLEGPGGILGIFLGHLWSQTPKSNKKTPLLVAFLEPYGEPKSIIVVAKPDQQILMMSVTLFMVSGDGLGIILESKMYKQINKMRPSLKSGDMRFDW